MESFTSKEFRKQFEELPEKIQEALTEHYEKWKVNPDLVEFKKLNGMRGNLYSASIGWSWRAIALVSDDNKSCLWLFAGSHETYNGWIAKAKQQNEALWKNQLSERFAKRLETIRKKEQKKLLTEIKSNRSRGRQDKRSS